MCPVVRFGIVPRVGLLPASACGLSWAHGPSSSSVRAGLPGRRGKDVFPKGRSLQLQGLRLTIGSIHHSPLILLLLLSGQCPNPGPRHPCGVCARNVGQEWAYLCSGCQLWIHRACSNITSRAVYHGYRGSWRCRTCIAQASPPSPPPPTPLLPPTPPDAPSASVQGHFLQFNTNGILNSHQQLNDLLQRHNILIACIQESKLTPTSKLDQFQNFATVRRDRLTGGGGGLITLIRHDVDYIEVDSSHLFPGDTFTEHLAVEVELDGAKLMVVNVYVPPVSSTAGFIPNLTHLFSITRDVLVMGDFNAHDARWYSQTQDAGAARRGASICDALDAGELMCINGDSHTRAPQNGPLTSPDLTFTNPHLGINARWEPIVTMNSDHLPIIVDLDGWFSAPPYSGPSSYTNYRKADWTEFTRETEQQFNLEQPPTSAEQGEKVFRRILLNATRRNVPKGKVTNFTPGLTPQIRRLIRQRDEIRTTNPSDPRIPHLDNQIERDTNLNLQQHWRKELESCSISRCSGKLWRTIQRYSGKRSFRDPNQPIAFGGRRHSNRRIIANKFAKQFARPVPHRQNPATRRLIRHIRAKHRLNHNAMPFTPDQVKGVLRESGSSTAPSPDGLTILQLKNLGPLGLRYLCKLFNLSYAHSRLPSIWKHAILLPLLKPGKPRDQGSSYRPISLLCPASKVLERLMLRLIAPHFQLSNTQHGFRTGRSTTTALLPLTHQIAAGFNQTLPPCRTVAMAVDFSKAFDTVDHTALLRMIHESSMSANTVRWLCTYLRGRTASCHYSGERSSRVTIHVGVPQGSVLSPMLFNAYVSSYPHTAELCTSYADDFTASASHPDVGVATASLAAHARDVSAWADERKLQISAQKSTVTLFTSQTQQGSFHPQVPLNGTMLPLDQNPKILGVTFDPHFHFHKHVEALVAKAKQSLSILKALTGTNWGQQKETIVATFKALIDSTFMYAAPIWFPNASESSIGKLQTIQNSALRIATGCHMMSKIDHLHTEARILKVKEHLEMLCAQFLASCLHPLHPSYPIVTADSGPRRKKETLQTRCLPDVAGFMHGGVVLDVGTARGEIHTTAVRRSIEAREVNQVLGVQAPDINQEERELPRITRRTLAQMRSGYCSSLEDYRSRIGLSNTSICPCCRQEEHTVRHVFRCPDHPTTLEPLDLWLRPVRAAEFLRTLPFFDLPEAARPPPEPPPQQSPTPRQDGTTG